MQSENEFGTSGTDSVEMSDSRSAAVSAAIATWTGQLVDLGGRNTLLYYKDLKQGTLALDDGDADTLARLLASHRVRLSELFGSDALPAAARRARTVRSKERENFEERGLQTLFLSWGMATWTSTRSAATPAAPVLLRLARLVPRGSGDEDFEVSLPGDWEINPTLLHFLLSDHGIDVDADSLLVRIPTKLHSHSGVVEHRL